MERFLMILSLLLFLGLQSAHAADSYVVDVRRNITLADEDPVYKDFYLSMPTGSTFQKNMVVTAVRKINIRDASGANAMGEIFVPVGQLKIIAVYDKIAVAREFALLSRDDLPMLEQIGIMTGDTIETEGSFIDKSKPKPRKKVSQLPPVTPAAPPAPVTAAAKLTVTENPSQTLEKVANSDNNTLHE